MTDKEIKKAAKKLMLELEKICDCISKASDNRNYYIALSMSSHYESDGSYFVSITISKHKGSRQTFYRTIFLSSSYTKEGEAEDFLQEIANKLIK